MKTEVMITAGNRNQESVMSAFANTLRKPVVKLSKYYSEVLGEPISVRQTGILLNAQAAFFMTVFPVGCPLLLRFACCAWLVSALLKAKNALEK